jgi:hypothetical protein
MGGRNDRRDGNEKLRDGNEKLMDGLLQICILNRWYFPRYFGVRHPADSPIKQHLPSGRNTVPTLLLSKKPKAAS